MKKKISASLFKEVENVTNFSEVLKIISEKFPENIFLVEKNVKINFYQFNVLVNKCCNYFLKKNIKKKDVITINLSNSIEFIILYFAIIRYGAIINPIPYGTSNENLKSFLKLSKSKIFFTRKYLNKQNINNFVINGYGNFLKKINKYSENFSGPKIFAKDICVLYFSSGTTEKSKLIKYSN